MENRANRKFSPRKPGSADFQACVADLLTQRLA